MNTETVLKIIGALVGLAAAGFAIRFVVSRKSTKVIQKGNNLSGGSQMAGGDINNKKG